ncbi:hypothetical protein GCM10007416_09200 [Kroppenstedtia guangzhouensis]|uniref:Outer membrane lipoprotein-sorting protein n=1 Tax=Kroppenstedtia guangzhouensis TaxID=1274356 RepID=A0ABQ1G7U4_9BACL|nr:hypothetical protein [Kroppenstedtia guangzhouensis]GGA38449.1 hypothetical protein GCM10007416_09200 [Kroppenstedtia guangzhouensis]
MHLRYWTGWLLTLALVLLSGCHGEHEKGSEEQATRFHLFRHIDGQLNQSRYPFTLSVHSLRFNGKQQGVNWFLESQDPDGEKRIRIRKEGNTIFLSRGKQAEKLKTRQFGLLSPRDHLLLIKSTVLRIQPLPENKKGLIGVQAVLSSEEIGDRLGAWMGEGFEQGAANQASRKFRIRYHMWYRPNQDGLSILRMGIYPQVKGQPGEKMIYHFGKP